MRTGLDHPMARLHSLVSMGWLERYGIESTDDPSALGEPATLTVILRDLDTDRRSHAIVPVEAVGPGEAQRETIMRAMAGRFPDARWKTYNEETQVASFVGRQHLYIVIYEEHSFVKQAEPQPPLFVLS